MSDKADDMTITPRDVRPPSAAVAPRPGRTPGRVAAGYAIAVLAVVVAVEGTLGLWTPIFSRNPFALFYAAVIVAAWGGGLGPGLLATALAVGAIDTFVQPSFISPLHGWHDLVQAGTFVFVTVLISSLDATRRRAFVALRAAKESAEQSREAAMAAKRSAESANRAKDQFLAVLSHELRTPLAPALAMTAARAADASLSKELREDLQMIRRNIELEARLIDDLLDLTRISRGKLQLRPEPVDMHALVGHVAAICGSDARNKKLDLKIELSAPNPWVRGDPARLHQVVWNLVKNAVKFTSEGGAIRICTRAADESHGPGRLVLEVADTGRGIDPQTLPRIFNAFEQGDETTQRQFGGLGLGLAISRALVNMHEGSLTAHSEGLGRGSTFAVNLASTAAPGERAHPAEKPGLGGLLARDALQVLLVEDHEDTARVMSRLLGALGHSVTTANCLAGAIEAAENQSFDLLLSDLGLPDGTGLDVIRRIGPTLKLGGIALSGYGMEEDTRRAQDAGFVAHLTKPINFDTLAALIQDLQSVSFARSAHAVTPAGKPAPQDAAPGPRTLAG